MSASPTTPSIDKLASAASQPPDSGLAPSANPFVELYRYCRRKPLWAIGIAIFVITWTIELYAVQGYTLVFPNDTGPRYAFFAPKIRFVLDLLFVCALTLLVRRRWLIPMAIISFFIYLGLITYFRYFLRPISILTILSNWREGLALGGFALDMFPRGAALLLLVALAIQVAALILSRNGTLPSRSAWTLGLLLAAAYAGLYAVTIYVDPLDAILTTRGVGRLGYSRGYLGPWFAEWYYLGNDELLKRAIDNRDIVYNRITPLEADIPIERRIVIIQAESLDTNILDYKVDGVPVTPFLNSLREQSMFYRVRAVHSLGSSDADFAVLNGVRGSAHENTYSIPGYPYESTTPQLLAGCGFETYAFHGNSGEFYNRRAAYEQMDFTGLRFQEELVGHYDLKADRWGITDRDLLPVSAQELRTAKKPMCHFVITLTTHTPYTILNPAENRVFPNPRSTAERYFNNMRYLDTCLRDYVTSLGTGTTVMIYADHPTEVFDGFECDRDIERNMEFIPCLIYDTDHDLGKLQKTRHDPRSTNGTWNLVDVANYLRAQIKRNFPAPHPGGARSDDQPDAIEHAQPAAK